MSKTLRNTTVASVAALLLGACGLLAPQEDSPAGDMSDDSYLGQRGRTQRPNAKGESVALEQFAGRFIWAEYAAPWCGPCKAQAPAARKAEKALGEDVVFLTIMTSDEGGYGDPATRRTALRWAKTYRLDPERVLAADLTAMTVPRHIFFSPEGQVLYERTGQMSAAKISSTASRYMDDWREWKVSGERARWMR